MFLALLYFFMFIVQVATQPDDRQRAGRVVGVANRPRRSAQMSRAISDLGAGPSGVARSASTIRTAKSWPLAVTNCLLVFRPPWFGCTTEFHWIVRRRREDIDYEDLPEDSDVATLRRGYASITRLNWQLRTEDPGDGAPPPGDVAAETNPGVLQKLIPSIPVVVFPVIDPANLPRIPALEALLV